MLSVNSFYRFLEDELARRYREAAPATLALLQERCEALAKELLAADSRLQACKDVAALRRAGEAASYTAFVAAACRSMHACCVFLSVGVR
jgi:hypothetical protein